MKHTATLYNPVQARSALEVVWKDVKAHLMAGTQLVLSVRPAAKTRSQEQHYHALIGDIADQWSYAGRKWDAEDMKRLLVAAFKEDTKNDPDFAEEWKELGEFELAPGIRGGFTLLGTQTRKFPKKLASAFIDWLYAFGAEMGVTFKEQK